MTPAVIGILGIVILLLMLFLLGTPVGFAMGIVGFCGFCYLISFKAGLNMLGSVLWETFSKYGLTVIPLFIFMGQIAFYSGVNEKLYKAAYQWVGQIRGGVAMATIMACSAFSAICGSNAATAATMTTVALPQMKKFRYDSRLSTGAIACGSTLGVVIPPSVVLIDRYRAFHRTVHRPSLLRRDWGRYHSGFFSDFECLCCMHNTSGLGTGRPQDHISRKDKGALGCL